MASITCRNGETFPNIHKHSSVAEVRQCQGVPAQLAMFTPKVNTAEYQGPGRFRDRVDPELEAKVPAGRYAVTLPGGQLNFYRVDKPTTGSWAGRTFVKVQASDELYPIRSAASRAQILEAIAADVKAAAIRYGRELGVCSQCGRTLTDPESIAKGIGPICETRLG